MDINGTSLFTIIGVVIASLTALYLAFDGVATGVGWLLEKCAAFFFRNRRLLSGSEALVGTVAVVSSTFVTSGAQHLSGWVTVNGERWRARLMPAETHIPSVDESVLVADIDGLVLIVASTNRDKIA